MSFILRMLRPRIQIKRRLRRRNIGIRGETLDFIQNKELARSLVHNKLTKYNEYYNHSYNKVAIRNQSTRWGSCSKRGNLNFHYRIVQLPDHLQDYLIVHELCHLTVFNHSKKFWELVSRTIPDHHERRKELVLHSKNLQIMKIGKISNFN